MPDLANQRARMVQDQVAQRGVSDLKVLAAMGRVPREHFVPEHLAELAYEDRPLPIEAGQTISQPYVVALMTQAAETTPSARVLEIGTGSGYAAAVLSRLVDRVYTIERHADLAEAARRRIAALGYDNMEVRTGDGTLGWPEAAPFDAILVTAGGPDIPSTLRRQLRIGGRLVMPVGRHGDQRLVKLVRTEEDGFRQEDLGEVMFVPLIGAHAWREDGGALG